MRKTKFKWFTDKSRKHLTERAKNHLRRKLTIYYRKKKKGIKRIRRQVCFNSEYNISIRALTISTPISSQTLRGVLYTFIENDKYLRNLKDSFNVEGIEEEEIDESEDKGLKKGMIYIELNARGRISLIPYQNVTTDSD